MSQPELFTRPAPTPPNTENIPIDAANRLQAAQRAHRATRDAYLRANGAAARDALLPALDEAKAQLDDAMTAYRAALRATALA